MEEQRKLDLIELDWYDLAVVSVSHVNESHIDNIVKI